MPAVVNLTIDGIEASVDKGTTILQAAKFFLDRGFFYDTIALRLNGRHNVVLEDVKTKMSA